VPLGRPTAGSIRRLEPPVVLAFGMRTVRERWRGALLDFGMMESRDFTFVA